MNDIVDNIQSQVKLFADDTSIFLIVDNAIESADILNRDLNTITSSSNKQHVVVDLANNVPTK
jgi:hypothetical protein